MELKKQLLSTASKSVQFVYNPNTDKIENIKINNFSSLKDFIIEIKNLSEEVIKNMFPELLEEQYEEVVFGESDVSESIKKENLNEVIEQKLETMQPVSKEEILNYYKQDSNSKLIYFDKKFIEVEKSELKEVKQIYFLQNEIATDKWIEHEWKDLTFEMLESQMKNLSDYINLVNIGKKQHNIFKRVKVESKSKDGSIRTYFQEVPIEQVEEFVANFGKTTIHKPTKVKQSQEDLAKHGSWDKSLFDPNKGF